MIMILVPLIATYAKTQTDQLKQQKNIFEIQNILFRSNWAERNLQTTCHYSCLSCQGQTKNDCLTCDPENGRILDINNSQCKCLQHLIEVDGDQKCHTFGEIIPNSIFSENKIQKSQSCQFGYFKIFINQQEFLCSKCPLTCIDCLVNSETWYLRPICTVEYVSQINSFQDESYGYKLTEKNKIRYDVFVITNEFQLQHCPFFQHICTLEESLDSLFGCKNVYQTHLNKQIQVLCKSNTYYYQNECFPCKPHCITCDSQNCNECDIGYYQQNQDCLQCPQNCQTCVLYYDFVECTLCQQFYTSFSNQCIQCGANCEVCVEDYDWNIGEFIRCLKCVDPNKYFISANAQDCFPIFLNNCLYQFQTYNLVYFYRITYDYQFRQFQSYYDQIYDVCARCKNGYDLYYGECIEGGNYPNCQMHYTGKYADLCLIGDDQFAYQNNQCQERITNCQSCIYENFVDKEVCIVCLPGHYAHRLQGYCIECPVELNCKTCYQQQIIEKDYWTQNIRAYYEGVVSMFFIQVEGAKNRNFRFKAQSSMLEDYEIVCEVCQEGYELFNYKCIEVCPSNCVECQIKEGKNQCIKCGFDSQGRMKTLIDNQCISCPQNCLLCKPREEIEIQNINPFFDDLEFISYTHICVSQLNFLNKQLSYDNQVGQFKMCSISDEICENQLVIQYYFYCNKYDYDEVFKNLENTDQQNLFLAQNIYFKDFITNGFSRQQNQYFYELANKHQISTIIFKISSPIKQVCLFRNENQITLNFRSHIFYLKKIQLEILGLNQTTFVFSDTTSFTNFTSILLDSIILQFQNSQIIPVTLLQFQSITDQDIIFSNITITTDVFKETNFSIQIQNFQKVELKNLEIQNVAFKSISGFFNFSQNNKGDSSNGIKIYNLKIQNLHMVSSFFFAVQSKIFTSISLDQFSVDHSTLFQSNFFKCQTAQSCGDINITEFNSTFFEIIESEIFSFGNAQNLEMHSLLLINLTLRQSTFIDLAQKTKIIHLVFENVLLFQSKLIQNTINEQLINQQYSFSQFFLNNVQYDQSSKCLIVYAYTSQISSIQVEKLQIMNLKYFGSQLSNLKQLQLSLFILQSNSISLQEVYAEIEEGLPYFSFLNSKNLLIEKSTFKTTEQTYLNFHNAEINDLAPIFLIFSSEKLIVSNLVFTKIISFNYPLFVYQSSPINFQKTNETIIFQNCKFQEILLFQTKEIISQSILDFRSFQNINIVFEKIIFQQNILYSKTLSNKIQLSTLIVVDGVQIYILFNFCQFLSNAALNTENSIINIKAKEINIQQSQFLNNGIFSEQIGQVIKKLSIIETDNLIFQASGAGLLNADSLIIKECYFFNQKGTKGSIINYSPLSNGSIVIDNSIFHQSENYFIFPNEKGGCIYVVAASTDLIVNISNSTFNRSFSNEGGLLYLEEYKGNLQIHFQNVIILNYFSLKGTIISAKFTQNNYMFSFIYFDNIIFTNEESQFYRFCQLISLDSSKDSTIWANIFNGRALIQVYLSNVILKNSKFENLYNEMLLQDYSINSLYTKNITVQNSYLSVGGIFNLQPIQSKQIIFSLEDSEFQNLSILDWWRLSLSDNSFSQFLASIEQQLNYKFQSSDQEINIYSIVNIENCHQSTFIKFRQILFKNNLCDSCLAGLIYLQFNETKEQNLDIKNLKVRANSCGNSSCFLILKTLLNNYDFSLSIDSQSNLQETNLNLFKIDRYQCQKNFARIGTCLYLEKFKGTINNSIFSNNTANESGGAIFYDGTFHTLELLNTQIFENNANSGGGVVFYQSFSPVKQNNLFIQSNIATYFGDQELQFPQYLRIKLNQQFYLNQSKYFEVEDSQKIIQQCFQLNQTSNMQNNFEYLPSGQKISSYKYLDWDLNQYQSTNTILRLIPFDKLGTQIKNLEGSKCTVEGRYFALNDPEKNNNSNFTDNFTNINQIYYDQENEDYNFDNLIIYFDPYTTENYTLQLQFKCDAIQIPILSSNGENIVGQSDEYYVRLNIRTFPCQLGEIKSEKDYSCHPCDFASDFYSVTLNATQCKIRDNQMMDEIRSAQIKLRSGYWRPYINSEIVENCYNQESNCLGGWNPGDKSCAIGHIGALCEQCDIHNIRGDGSYSISKKFSCGSCNDTKQNTLVIIGISIWTLISILISVKSTVEIVKQLARATKLKSIGISIVVNKNNAVNLMKILTNYLQIIASVTSFQLSLPKNMDYFINSLGNPVETMAYSLDCFLKDMFKNIEIQYSRTIWQLIMPILYIITFFLLYGTSIALKQIEYSFCAISTTLIYMFIYLQPNIVAGQIGLLSYRSISDNKWILGNVAFKYDTVLHTTWILSYCLPILLIVGIMVPVFFLVSLNRVQNSLNLIINRLVWGYLYNEYKQIAYYWEIVKIVQKVLIILFLTFYSDQIIVKATLVYAIIFIYNYFTNLINPYQSMKLNILDHDSTRICGISIVLGVGIYGAIKNEILEVQIPFYIVLALVNFLFLSKLILEIIQAYFLKFEIILDQVRDLIRKLFPNLLKYPYLARILKNSAQARLTAYKNFRKAKAVVLLISKQNLTNQNFKRIGTFIIDTQQTFISGSKQFTTEQKLSSIKEKE